MNCGYGYARVAIWQLSEVGKVKKHNEANCGRNEKFQDRFAPLTTYGIDSAIFKGYEHNGLKSGRLLKLNKATLKPFPQRIGKSY